MVLQKRRFERIAVGLNGAVDMFGTVGTEWAGAGESAETVRQIEIGASESSLQVHIRRSILDLAPLSSVKNCLVDHFKSMIFDYLQSRDVCIINLSITRFSKSDLNAL
jgi:hypothetical protein